MNNPQNLSEAISLGISNSWYIFVGCLLLGIIITIGLKKFEKWAYKKIKKIKKK